MKIVRTAIILALGMLLPLAGFAAGGDSVEACRTKTAEDMDKRLHNNRPAVYEMYKRSPQDLCAFSSNAKGIDNSRCEQSVQELHSLINERRQKRIARCDEKKDLDKYNGNCANNMSALQCQQQDVNINRRFKQGNARWKAAQGRIAEAVKKVEDEMFKLSEDYAKNLEAVERDKANNVQNSSAASEIGASSPQEAVNMHGGESASKIYQAINDYRNRSDISQSDIQKLSSMKDSYASESLYLAATAKAARREMEKDNSLEDSRDQAVGKNTNKVSDNNSKLSAVDPEASQSGSAGAGGGSAAGAASGLAGLGGGGGGSSGLGADQQLSDSSYSSAGTKSYGLNSQATNGGSTNTTAIQDIASADPADGDGGRTNSSSASRMPVRDSLRARLAGELAQGASGGATGASQAAATKAGDPAGAKAKEKASGQMLAGFAPEDFTAGEGSFSMAQSETDAAVKEMMTEFEGSLGEGETGLGRNLASASGNEYAAPEILAEDSSDLFLRTREYYERCQKRGCVTR